MNLFRDSKTQGASRPSVLVNLRMVDKKGEPLDPSTAWEALKIAFKDHPTLDIFQATVSPDKEAE